MEVKPRQRIIDHPLRGEEVIALQEAIKVAIETEAVNKEFGSAILDDLQKSVGVTCRIPVKTIT